MARITFEASKRNLRQKYSRMCLHPYNKHSVDRIIPVLSIQACVCVCRPILLQYSIVSIIYSNCKIL